MKVPVKDCLIMYMDSGNFYPIEIVEGVSKEQQAKDHGALNPHLSKIEDASGAVLWESPEETIH